MLPTYSQLIDSALTDAAMEGRERFSFTWLRSQIRAQARKVKKRLGPRLNQAILRVLTDGEKLGYFILSRGRKAQVDSIYMSEGGRHEYSHKDIVVMVEAQVTTAKTRKEASLLQENQFLRSQLEKIAGRLARADSIIDYENEGHVEVVTGTLADITERIKRLVALSKNRKQQIAQMYEGERFQNELEVLNDYYERDIQERREHEERVQAYQECRAEEERLANTKRGNKSEE